jgi:hypothetical protein
MLTGSITRIPVVYRKRISGGLLVVSQCDFLVVLARTGQFIPVQHAIRRPSTTVIETVKKPKSK